MPQNQKIGAVSIGSSIQNKSHFDYTNSVVTTHGFTEVQPEFFRLFETPGSMRLKTECEVRVAPINVPTFGLIQKKFWHYFFRWNNFHSVSRIFILQPFQLLVILVRHSIQSSRQTLPWVCYPL